jgi:hypothetical protein
MSSGNLVVRMPINDGHMYHIQCDDFRPHLISRRACSKVGQGAPELYQRPDWQDKIRSSTGLRVATDAALTLDEFALGQKQLIVLLIPRRNRLPGLRDFAARWPRRIDEGLMMKKLATEGACGRMYFR